MPVCSGGPAGNTAMNFLPGHKPLWRRSIASTTPPLKVADKVLYEWGGALRWIKTDLPTQAMQHMALTAGGHATLFRPGQVQAQQQPQEIFQTLPDGLMQLHKNIKRAFDPNGILNPGRVYPEL